MGSCPFTNKLSTICIKFNGNRHLTAVYGEFESLDAHLGNGIGRSTATLAAPLLLSSGPFRYEAVLHSCGASPGGGERQVPTCDSAHSW